MSFPSSFDDALGWDDTPELGREDVVTAAIKKEKVVSEIIAMQENLRELAARVKTVQGEVDKLASGNETLQMYIDNLTLQMAKRR